MAIYQQKGQNKCLSGLNISISQSLQSIHWKKNPNTFIEIKGKKALNISAAAAVERFAARGESLCEARPETHQSC